VAIERVQVRKGFLIARSEATACPPPGGKQSQFNISAIMIFWLIYCLLNQFIRLWRN